MCLWEKKKKLFICWFFPSSLFFIFSVPCGCLNLYVAIVVAFWLLSSLNFCFFSFSFFSLSVSFSLSIMALIKCQCYKLSTFMQQGCVRRRTVTSLLSPLWETKGFLNANIYASYLLLSWPFIPKPIVCLCGKRFAAYAIYCFTGQITTSFSLLPPLLILHFAFFARPKESVSYLLLL